MVLNVKPDEIIFTGSGTESDNLAILGAARAHKDKGQHIITSKIEHKAVLESTRVLKREGFDITYLNVNSKGIVDLEELRSALREDTILVSIMYANNEIGTIQPIKEISSILKENGDIIFHTDACQAAGYLNITPNSLGVDLLTLDGSKIYGPKGVGCLFKSGNIRLEPIIIGGAQENKLRAGTENTPLIVGFAEALKLVDEDRGSESNRLTELRDYFIKEVKDKIKNTELNGHAKKRLPNNINISFSDVEGESIVLMLDGVGIAASTGSACASSDLEPSYVLVASGVPKERAHESVRFSMGRGTTKKDIDYVLSELPGVIKKLRDISSTTI
jgi:cysteine desulfurase